MRTDFCGRITEEYLDQEVTVCGWIHRRRDHGGVIFLDVRDLKGICQAVISPDNKDAFALADSCRSEYVIQVTGKVRPRPEGTVNNKMFTGKVEIDVQNINLLNKAETPAFPLDDYQDVNEDVRLKHRVLDLRRPEMNARILKRSQIVEYIRKFLEKNNFNEIETPILTRATPEGARDYVLPSRVHPGNFYALPQSPQLFKQMLMMAGMDRYYQIARCFRDEDLRADRQPEFTQVDVEASFIDQGDIIDLGTELILQLLKEFADSKLERIESLSFQESMDRFGCDKPDLRIPLELKNIGHLAKNEEFKVFAEPATLDEHKVVALRVPGGNSLSRSQIDGYTDFVGKLGAKGLAYIKVNSLESEDGLQSPILKFLSKTFVNTLINDLSVEKNDLIFFGAGSSTVVNLSLIHI